MYQVEGIGCAKGRSHGHVGLLRGMQKKGGKHSTSKEDQIREGLRMDPKEALSILPKILNSHLA